MLRIRQKRAVTFAKIPAQDKRQATNKNSAPRATTMPPTIASSSRPDKAKSRHTRNSSTTTTKRTSQHPSCAPTQVSNRQRRLASLFMALMASSPLPIEADAETLRLRRKTVSRLKLCRRPQRKRNGSAPFGSRRLGQAGGRRLGLALGGKRGGRRGGRSWRWMSGWSLGGRRGGARSTVDMSGR